MTPDRVLLIIDELFDMIIKDRNHHQAITKLIQQRKQEIPYITLCLTNKVRNNSSQQEYAMFVLNLSNIIQKGEL